MPSTFATPRIFYEPSGWFISMRASDEEYLHGPKHKVIAGQHLMGPFNDKRQVENWLAGFISMHGKDRKTNTDIPDSLATRN